MVDLMRWPCRATIDAACPQPVKRLAEMLPKAAHLNVIRAGAGIIENSPDGRLHY
jgi:hypothetical protein